MRWSQSWGHTRFALVLFPRNGCVISRVGKILANIGVIFPSWMFSMATWIAPQWVCPKTRASLGLATWHANSMLPRICIHKAASHACNKNIFDTTGKDVLDRNSTIEARQDDSFWDFPAYASRTFFERFRSVRLLDTNRPLPAIVHPRYSEA